MSSNDKKSKHIKRLTRWIWGLFLFGIIFGILFIISIRINLADNVLLGSYYRKNRSQIEYKDLSPELVNTLVFTEDYRFYNHSGISFPDLVRVAIKTIILQQADAGGGSTITQQLAKNLFKTRTDLNDGKLNNVPLLGMLIIKIKEMIMAVELEKNFTKKEILAMFLNTIEFGGNSYGIKVATQTFFNKTPAEINYQEAACLVAMVNKPTRFNPVRNPEVALEKRNQILRKITNYDILTPAEADSITLLPIELNYKVDSHNEGLATYFRSYIRDYLMNWCDDNEYDLWEDGLRIYTTIDSRVQQYAETAVEEHMKYLQEMFLEQWGNRNPWVDDNGRELRDYVNNAIKRTSRYRELVDKYGENSDSVRIILNTPYKMKVFSWDGEIDTVLMGR
jgi:penicillin-binding protein 1A